MKLLLQNLFYSNYFILLLLLLFVLAHIIHDAPATITLVNTTIFLAQKSITHTHIHERARTRTHRPPQTKHITAFSLYIIYFISHILTRLFGNVFFIYVLRYFFFASTLGPPA